MPIHYSTGLGKYFFPFTYDNHGEFLFLLTFCSSFSRIGNGKGKNDKINGINKWNKVLEKRLEFFFFCGTWFLLLRWCRTSSFFCKIDWQKIRCRCNYPFTLPSFIFLQLKNERGVKKRSTKINKVYFGQRLFS